MPTLTHPNGGRIEATPAQVPLYLSAGWRTATKSRAPRKKTSAPRKDAK